MKPTWIRQIFNNWKNKQTLFLIDRTNTESDWWFRNPAFAFWNKSNVQDSFYGVNVWKYVSSLVLDLIRNEICVVSFWIKWTIFYTLESRSYNSNDYFFSQNTFVCCTVSFELTAWQKLNTHRFSKSSTLNFVQLFSRPSQMVQTSYM
jgi:hypothetical protein